MQHQLACSKSQIYTQRAALYFVNIIILNASDYQKIDCLLNTLVRSTSKEKIRSCALLAFSKENPLTKSSNAESVSTSWNPILHLHYGDVIMGAIASQITSLRIIYSTVYSGADQRKHQNSESLAFLRGFHQRPANSPHKGPVTRIMFPFDDVTMTFGRSNHFAIGSREYGNI